MAKGTVNKVFIIGNVGLEPILKRTDKCNFIQLTIATIETWKSKQTHENKERTEWHTITVYGKLADVVDRIIHKGDKISVVGRMQTRKFIDDYGLERERVEVIGEDVQLIAST